jgi:hypothetical protein
MLNEHPAWQEQEYPCTQCAWTGTGSELAETGVTSDFVEMRCPECNHFMALAFAPGALRAAERRAKPRA